jgi:hypothetical protein
MNNRTRVDSASRKRQPLTKSGSKHISAKAPVAGESTTTKTAPVNAVIQSAAPGRMAPRSEKGGQD